MPEEEDGEWWCTFCDAEFATKAALCAHKFAAHGVRASARQFIDGSGVCPVCRGVFHSRRRVLKHVQGPVHGSALCSEIVASGVLPRLSDAQPRHSMGERRRVLDLIGFRVRKGSN